VRCFLFLVVLLLTCCLKLPSCRSRPPHLPFPWFYFSGQVEHWTRVPISVRPRRVRYGRRWLQGQMVGVIPCHYAQYFQRCCEQLVERPLGTPRKGLSEVRTFFSFCFSKQACAYVLASILNVMHDADV